MDCNKVKYIGLDLTYAVGYNKFMSVVLSLIFILSFLAYLKVPYRDLSYFLSISTIFLSQLLIFLVDYTLMIHL